MKQENTSITTGVPQIEVGIMQSETIRFCLNGKYSNPDTGEIREGLQEVSVHEKGLPFILQPVDYQESSFDLFDVVIGIDFHWERKETQRFKGALKLIRNDKKIQVINVLPLEDYLLSVISSEMNALSAPDLLKAHAVISRSWLLAQQYKKVQLDQESYQTIHQTEDEYIRWYDREDHTLFDVCADDHCQRYQGITRVTTRAAEEAVRSTSGEVLTYDGKICDTRFSKCCGGVSEAFEQVWEPVAHPYLSKIVDNPQSPYGFKQDLTQEENAEKWILGNPEAFCNTQNLKVLSTVLNDYDQETSQFYRWQEEIPQEKLQQLLLLNTGHDFGEIIDMLPVERGLSGRLVRLKIIGTKKTLTIGKELVIRKSLSDSHLYSSAFVVQKVFGTSSQIPESFVLIGAGWGHGVGLCQIGAAVMAEKGYSYREILTHYFPGACLENISIGG